MRKYQATLTEAPENVTMTLAECPVGLFIYDETLCLKTEYGDNNGRIDAYIVESGEFFWGGTSDPKQQRNLEVLPIVLKGGFE